MQSLQIIFREKLVIGSRNTINEFHMHRSMSMKMIRRGANQVAKVTCNSIIRLYTSMVCFDMNSPIDQVDKLGVTKSAKELTWNFSGIKNFRFSNKLLFN